MWTAITRQVSSAIEKCELGFLPRQDIDIAKAVAQHRQYEAALAAMGVHVVSLPPEPDLPDAVFVEDPAVVVDELAVMTRMGAESRRKEAESLGRALAPFRPLRWLEPPATLEGGDVLRVGRTVLAGISTRTNAAGVAQLAAALQPFGYTVEPVKVCGCLHLKTAACSLGDGTVLANRSWLDLAPFRGFRIVDVAPEEPWSANVLTIGETVLMPTSFPATAGIVERLGWKVRTVDVSELMKAEAGLTCMSLLLK
jgi:dimethylargininase